MINTQPYQKLRLFYMPNSKASVNGTAYYDVNLSPELIKSGQNAYQAWQQGQYAKAAELFTIILKQITSDQLSLSIRGDCYRLLGQYDLAQEDLKKVLAVEPQNTFALSSLGAAFIETGKFKQAEELLTRSITIKKEAFSLWLLGIVYRDTDRLELALTLLDQSLSISPESITILISRGMTLFKLKQYEKAAQDFSKILAKQDKNYHVKTYYAMANFSLGKKVLARTMLEDVVRQDSNNFMAKGILGDIYKSQGKYDDAIELFEEILRQHEGDDMIQTKLADIYRQKG